MTIQRYKMENGSVGYYTKTDKGFFVEKDAKEYWKQEGDKLGGAETSGTLERMAIGGGKKVHDLVSGINDLTDSNLPGGNSRYDASESYRQLKEDNPLSVGGGEVLSEIGQMVAPGFGLIRGAAQIPKLGTAGAAFVGDSAAAVGMAGLRAPGDDGETRLGNMGGEAVASAAGGAFGQLLKKLAYGSKLVGETPEQQQLVREALDSGQDLTLGQAGAGVAAKGAHKLASIVPFISRPVDVWNKETIANWHKHILEAAKYPGTKITKSGREGANEVVEGYNKAYKDVWSNVKWNQVRPDKVNAQLTLGIENLVKQDDVTKLKAWRKVIDGQVKAMDNAAPDVKGAYMDAIDKTIQGFKNEASGEGRDTLAAIMADASSVYRSELPDEILSQLSKIDEIFPNQKLVSDLANETSLGIFGPKKAEQIGRRVAGKEQWRRGDGPLQDLIETGVRTLGNPDSKSAGLIAGTTKDLPSPIPSSLIKGILNPLIGNSPTQKAIRSIDDIRKNVAGGAVEEVFSPQRIAAGLYDGNPNEVKLELQSDFDKLMNRLLKGMP